MSSSTDNRLKVFMCHAAQDKPLVRNLYQRLVAAGMDPWIDEESLLPGQDWNVEIRAALRRSDAIIVCLSNHSVTKVGYVQKEIKYALDVADEQPEGAIFLIPARIDDCQIPSRLSHLHSPDVRQEKGYRSLLAALQVRATILGRFVQSAPPPPDVDQIMRSNFAKAFAEIFWECFPDLRLKLKRSFIISLIGGIATGKTALGYALTGGGFDLFSHRTTGDKPYGYKFPFQKTMHITDHRSYSVDPAAWGRSIEYLRSESDLIVLLTSSEQSLGSRDLHALDKLQHCNTPSTLVANKMDLLEPAGIADYLRYLENATNHVPLPISIATGLNLDLLKRFFVKGRQMYS
jgi:hypothetical protein